MILCRVYRRGRRCYLSHFPVKEVFDLAIFEGGPWATILPPCLPPPGPRSMMWSAWRMMSRLCSTMMRELPASRRLVRAVRRISMSLKWRPVVGSSRR